MKYLIILSLVSISGALLMLAKKIREVEPHAEVAGHEAHTNFILDSLRGLKTGVKIILFDAYLYLRPHAHNLASAFAGRMYKISSWFAREFLKFYNFIQGRKVLKNSGNTSLFIRNIAGEKEGVNTASRSRTARI